MRALAATVLRPGLALRRPLARLGSRPRLRRRALLLLAAALMIACLYHFWARDSGLVGVESVSISGLTTSQDAARVRQALAATAREMTTLHVRRDRLAAAVAGYPIVERLEVSADFPHRLAIHVVERRPAALALTAGGRVPVAGDGSVLAGVPGAAALPVVEVPGRAPRARLRDAGSRRLVAVLGAAPGALRARLRDARRTRGRGIVVRIDRGPDLVFGPAARVRAKWIAAARVLADPKAAGAAYVDLHLPERPAVGGLPAAEAPAPADGSPPTAPATPGTLNSQP